MTRMFADNSTQDDGFHPRPSASSAVNNFVFLIFSRSVANAAGTALKNCVQAGE
jgi:hypothetical protein